MDSLLLVLRVLYSHCNTFAVHDIGFEAQHGKHHQGGQHRSEEIDKRHQDGIKVAVVVALVVAGEGNDATEPETQREKDLRGCLTPDLGLQHDLQLKTNRFELSLSSKHLLQYKWMCNDIPNVTSQNIPNDEASIKHLQ